MRAIEFNSKIENDRIVIPCQVQADLKLKDNASVRVIFLIADAD